jgi:hypothetical protein
MTRTFKGIENDLRMIQDVVDERNHVLNIFGLCIGTTREKLPINTQRERWTLVQHPGYHFSSNAGEREETAVYSLKQAAEAVGRGKPAILKAIKSGRISAKKDAFGQWQIEPVELHRVYPMVTGNGSGITTGERRETPKEVNDVGDEAVALRERLLADKDALIADLRNERDRLLKLLEENATSVRLLTDERQKAQQPKRRKWWPWRHSKQTET